jgi:hypothetical protein
MNRGSELLDAARSAILCRCLYPVLRQRMRRAPFPADALHGEVPGPRPLLLQVIGEATAIGYQTLTADLTIGARLARGMALQSGRGVRWEAVAASDLTVRTCPALPREHARIREADVVVVLLGIGDALRRTPRHVWRTGLTELLAELHGSLAPSAVILVAEIPPLETSPETPSSVARRVGRYAEALNTVTRDVVVSIPTAVSIPFPTSAVHAFQTPDGQDTLYGRVYGAWAAVMVGPALGDRP